jgi:hypothetical protein
LRNPWDRTLQSLTEQPITSSIPQEIVAEASRRFREALALQETKKMLARGNKR